jgi:hypothetical protein
MMNLVIVQNVDTNGRQTMIICKICKTEIIESIFKNKDGKYILMHKLTGREYAHEPKPEPLTQSPESNGKPYYMELFSGKLIPRKRRYYLKDKEGLYYIPEVQNAKED